MLEWRLRGWYRDRRFTLAVRYDGIWDCRLTLAINGYFLMELGYLMFYVAFVIVVRGLSYLAPNRRAVLMVRGETLWQRIDSFVCGACDDKIRPRVRYIFNCVRVRACVKVRPHLCITCVNFCIIVLSYPTTSRRSTETPSLRSRAAGP